MNKVETFGDWRLDDHGLEYLPGGYWIAAERLGETRHGKPGVSDWALHILGKRWCNPEQFIPALKRAIERHAAKGIDWSATMVAVRKQAYLDLCWDEAERRLGPVVTPHNPLGVMDLEQLDKMGHLAEHLASVGWNGCE